jgi:hypothetical protein
MAHRSSYVRRDLRRSARAGLVVLALLVAPSTATAPVGAQDPSPPRPALLTDVEVASNGAADRVVFTFADGVLPEVTVVPAEPPFYDVPGEPVAVAGRSFLRVRMEPASGVDFGVACEPLEPATPGPGEAVVVVFWSCVLPGSPGAAPVAPRDRIVAETDAEGRTAAALEALLAGPTAEERAAGSFSSFSAITAGLLASFTLDPDGTAVVDLDPSLATLLPGASASAASDQLLRELDATVFQTGEVTEAEYRLGGSCDAFFAWLQRDCTLRTPADAAAATYAETYLGPDRVVGATANVTEAVAIEDFEALLVWVIGRSEPTPYTVATLSDPARIVVEVAHVVPAAPSAPTATARPTFTG